MPENRSIISVLKQSLSKHCNYSVRREKKFVLFLNSKEDKGMSENGKNMDENEKDLIENVQDTEDPAPEEGPGSGELTEEELREYEKKEKRDNAIISTVIDGIITFLHLS